MAKPSSISLNIDYEQIIDKDMIKKWNTVIPILKDKHVLSYEEIKPIYANKYKYDLVGLFKEVFNIPKEYIYPTIRVNGFDSLTDYDGNTLRFKRLDNVALGKYYQRFTS